MKIVTKNNLVREEESTHWTRCISKYKNDKNFNLFLLNSLFVSNFKDLKFLKFDLWLKEHCTIFDFVVFQAIGFIYLRIFYRLRV